ncbi:MAG: biotin--[acetyl-CoA-carboxylase] ligase [Lachnospirales bacterium]
MNNIIHINKVSSTNTKIREYEHILNTEKYVALYSDIQEQGRGRKGRVWESTHSDNIYLSIMTKTEIDDINMLTILAGVTLCEVLEKCSNLNPKIKWANDIYVKEKKLAGILTETSYIGTTLNYSIVGIGVNLNNKSFENYSETATSVYLETLKSYDKVSIIKNIIEQFNYNLNRYLEDSFDIKEYEQKIFHINKTVYLDEELVLTKGVTKNGNLIVETSQGELITLTFQEVSIKIKE